VTYPWETPVPAVVEPPQAPATVEHVVQALQRDMAYAVAHTAVLVHSPHEALQLLVNTPRGQIIPRGECKLTDGSTIEFQDIGMPQVGASLMTVPELAARVWEIVKELGLGVQP
jgi:hypothetical protein